ncbi:tRNA G18 (ribose-2'-O)-methylase SpoU [Haloferula luteola]|uniref:tRNA G18 (Ribose-2'-O)-methylase SpoU n=1 Tax=Haloferula luteola TaxID=595692 RepID=A0A840V4P8_9BACT|nr:RNA methyltransferase [Haloferula luteola]MBB5352995.1 tRNA G18 (ribose-2'-O)-methylase SpoU [Haloferula luteola]
MEWIDELSRQTRKRSDPWIVLEGRHAVEGAISGWWDVQGILAADDCEWMLPIWSGLELTRVERKMLEQVAGYAFHRGLIALAKLPDERRDVASLMKELPEDARVVVCPSLADASNAGAIVRNAAALGAQAVLFGDEGVSPYERKAVRASSGALFRIPIRVADGGQILRCLKAAKFRLVGADGGEETASLESCEWDEGRVALVIGSEDQGLNGFWKAACDVRVRIPMVSGVDSLNAAAASAVMLWEMKKARG